VTRFPQAHLKGVSDGVQRKTQSLLHLSKPTGGLDNLWSGSEKPSQWCHCQRLSLMLVPMQSQFSSIRKHFMNIFPSQASELPRLSTQHTKADAGRNLERALVPQVMVGTKARTRRWDGIHYKLAISTEVTPPTATTYTEAYARWHSQ
jgi:hypothetical protein